MFLAQKFAPPTHLAPPTHPKKIKRTTFLQKGWDQLGSTGILVSVFISVAAESSEHHTPLL